MKWYNFETSFRNLKNELSAYLKRAGIRYELSDCGRGFPCWHFEILTDPAGAEKINSFLDSICFVNQPA